MSNPLKKAVEAIVRIAKPDKIILFGSRATGKQKAASDAVEKALKALS